MIIDVKCSEPPKVEMNIDNETFQKSSEYFKNQPERSKREDSCMHYFQPVPNGWKCKECNYEMRCSEHDSNVMKEVQ